jgi:chromatin segregation and condensation protein Rec8/ScpA/Scc1 (kleisin family)
LPTITDVLSLLLALLELARRGQCVMTQAAVFAPLVIRRESSRSAD